MGVGGGGVGGDGVVVVKYHAKYMYLEFDDSVRLFCKREF